MLRKFIALVIGLVFSTGAFSPAAAEMGPCKPANFDLLCGSGDGAAHAVVKTISPSKRLAFAWRLANQPPINVPGEHNPELENFVVRIGDGAVLAKSGGSYWDLSTKIAKAYLMTAWSPDSHLLVKVEQRADFALAETFYFSDDDTATGPFDLGGVILPALRAAMKGTKGANNSVLVFAAHPAMAIDNQGLLHAAVFARGDDADGPTYDATVQIAHVASIIDAHVVALTIREAPTISVIVH